MKRLAIFVCLLVTVNGLLDVVTLFGPKISACHQFVGSLQKDSNAANVYVYRYTTSVINQKSLGFGRYLDYIKPNILSISNGILNETGMDAHPELITHCWKAENNSANTLMTTFLASAMLVLDMGNDHLNSKMNDFYVSMEQTLMEEHNFIEHNNKRCEDIETEFETIECCMENLYEKQDARQKVLKGEFEKWNQTMYNSVEIFINYTNTAFEKVINASRKAQEVVIRDFKECVLAAKP